MLTDEVDHVSAGSSDRRSTRAGERLREVVRHDVPASVVVFLVALPLSLGIAIASDAPIMSGLIAAVVGGVIAGALGGSPLLASGPAAGLTVVVAELVNSFGWAVTCAITVGAGALQIVFGLSRVARAALAISPIVVHAMLAGIGLTIALQQVHVLLGGTSRSSAWQNLSSLPTQIGNAHLGDFIIGATVIAILVLWKWVPAPAARIPGPLVAVVAATILSILVLSNVERIAIDGSLFDAIGLPSLPEGKWLPVALGVLTVALIASVESLLSAVAVDKLHSGRKSDLDRELVGQGAANMVSGLLGGLPVTGVIVRSATNVAAGAKSKASTVLHGIWILLFTLFFVAVVEQIPKAALAGLLIVIGVQLVKLAHIRLAHRTGDLWVYAITVAGVVFLNLLEGVLVGLVLAVLLVLARAATARVHAEPIGPVPSQVWRVTIEGTCSFLSLPKLSRALAKVPAGTNVDVEITVDFIDHAASDVVEEWARRHHAAGGTVTIDEIGSTAMEAAGQAPPQRRSAAQFRGVAPWSASQHQRGSGPSITPTPDGERSLHSMLTGISHFHRRHAPLLRNHLTDLHHGQKPTSLFVACSDSRLVPNLITSSGPGDLFTVRNVGNLVPAQGQDSSIEAAIVFAIGELGVGSIIVCGHSGCGAMAALLSDHDDVAEPVHEWLVHAKSTLQAFDAGHPVADSARDHGFGTADQLSMVNIAVQLENLQRHPLVAEHLDTGNMELAGLFFDIGSASVWYVSATSVRHAATPAPLTSVDRV